MKRKEIIDLVIALLIGSFLTWVFIDISYSPGRIQYISFEVEYDKSGRRIDSKNWKLKWNGRNGTELRLYEIAVFNVGSLGTLSWSEYDLGNRTVNYKEIFTISRGVHTVRIIIYYHHTEVTVDESGHFSEKFVLVSKK